MLKYVLNSSQYQVNQNKKFKFKIQNKLMVKTIWMNKQLKNINFKMNNQINIYHRVKKYVPHGRVKNIKNNCCI